MVLTYEQNLVPKEVSVCVWKLEKNIKRHHACLQQIYLHNTNIYTQICFIIFEKLYASLYFHQVKV